MTDKEVIIDDKLNRELLYSCEYSDRLLVEGETKKEALLKLLCNSYLKEKVYHAVRKIMGVDNDKT